MSKVNYFNNLNYPENKTWNKNHNFMNITMQNVHYSLANSIRRSIIGNIKTIGFRALPYNNSSITIEANNTYLNNEFIKHRISMIPVFLSEDDDYEDYEFILDEENNTNMLTTITTEHIQIRKISTDTMLNKRQRDAILPPNKITGGYIIIVKLKPKYYTNSSIKKLNHISQEINIPNSEPIKIKLKARLVKSDGTENSHFSPVSTCSYGYTIDESIISQKEEEYVRDINEENAKLGLSAIDEDTLRKRFRVNELEKYPVTDIYGDPNSFDFTIDSVGQYKPLELIHKALVYLSVELNNFINALRVKDESLIKISISETYENGFDIIANNMNDTLGNLIHCHIIKELCRYDLRENRKLNSFTYNKIHPLQNKILFTVCAIDNNISTDDVIHKILTPSLNNLISHIKEVDTNLHELYV